MGKKWGTTASFMVRCIKNEMNVRMLVHHTHTHTHALECAFITHTHTHALECVFIHGNLMTGVRTFLMV